MCDRQVDFVLFILNICRDVAVSPKGVIRNMCVQAHILKRCLQDSIQNLQTLSKETVRDSVYRTSSFMHPHPNTSSFEYSSFSEGLALISANLKYVAFIFCALRITSRECCGSGMFIPDPDFYPSRISDPRSKNSNKREG
jgi:hypothetical protein